jgi:hypothetical protein
MLAQGSHASCRVLRGRGNTEHFHWGVTVTPSAEYEGMVWGARREAFKGRVIGACDVRKMLQPTMPQAGEDIGSIADVCARVYGECVELDAGRIGEEILHGSAGTGFAHDYRQACELAALSCKTEEAIDLFIAHRKIASCDPLQPYGYLNIALSLTFKIARELSGEEVNNVVTSTVARWDLARRKRRDGLGVCASRMRRSSARWRT